MKHRFVKVTVRVRETAQGQRVRAVVCARECGRHLTSVVRLHADGPARVQHENARLRGGVGVTGVHAQSAQLEQFGFVARVSIGQVCHGVTTVEVEVSMCRGCGRLVARGRRHHSLSCQNINMCYAVFACFCYIHVLRWQRRRTAFVRISFDLKIFNILSVFF